MLTFISCAKTMTEKTPMVLPTASSPLFIEEARHIALSMTAYTAGELADMLHVNPQIAARTCLQFRTFHDEGATGLPALSAYTGMVFRHIAPQDFTAEDWAYAQSHLFITSFLYGLLRPADRIRNYRLEGHVRLPEKEDRTLFAYWRARLTDVFISAIRQQGGHIGESGQCGNEKLVRLDTRHPGSTGDYPGFLYLQRRTVVHRSGLCQDVPGRNDTFHPKEPN